MITWVDVATLVAFIIAVAVLDRLLDWMDE